MERPDAAAHRQKERVAPGPQLGRRRGVAHEPAHAVAHHPARGSHARQRIVDRRHPAAAAIGQQPVGQDISHRHPVVTNGRHLPERKLLPDREPQLRRQKRAVHHHIQRRNKRRARRDIDGRARQRLHRADRAGQRHDLRQRVHRLLQQDVAWRLEHPVPELLGPQLPQRDVVRAPDPPRPPERAACQQRPQPRHRRMMDEVLVHAERDARRRRRLGQRRALGAIDGQRLFHQHGLARPQQSQGAVVMQVGRGQHMCATEQLCVGQRCL